MKETEMKIKVAMRQKIQKTDGERDRETERQGNKVDIKLIE